MRTFVPLLAILLLLLPSSAAALVSVRTCAELQAMESMSCCCDHPESEAPALPSISKDCCCEWKSPLQVPSPPPFVVDGQTSVCFAAEPQETLRVPRKTNVSGSGWLPNAPPRAPPRPLFLQYSSFLI
ncbi:MAG: hypothetical protein ACYTEP_11390 [Planctomycetota bacterium]